MSYSPFVPVFLKDDCYKGVRKLLYKGKDMYRIDTEINEFLVFYQKHTIINVDFPVHCSLPVFSMNIYP